MQNIQNADFSNSEQQQSNENTLSKSADTLSAKELILQLNDNFIARKSKEYNFDFNKACSYDTAICESGGLLAVQQDNLFSSNFKVEKPKEIKLTGRKTSFSSAFNTNENKVENNNINNSDYNDDNNFAVKSNNFFIRKSPNLQSNKARLNSTNNLNCSKNYNNNISNFCFKNDICRLNCNANFKTDMSSLISGSCGNSNANYSTNNLHAEENKEYCLLGMKSHQTIGNLTRNTTSDAFKKLRERMQNLTLQKKNIMEFFEAKNQKEESEIDNDNPNVYFE